MTVMPLARSSGSHRTGTVKTGNPLARATGAHRLPLPARLTRRAHLAEHTATIARMVSGLVAAVGSFSAGLCVGAGLPLPASVLTVVAAAGTAAFTALICQ